MSREIFTSSGTKIANGFIRVVHRGRGDYIELSPNQIIKKNIFIPENEKWRMTYERAY